MARSGGSTSPRVGCYRPAVPPKRKSSTVLVTPEVKDEIEATARRVGRSVAFLVHRALVAAPAAAAPAGSTPLALATDEDDPAGLVGKIEKAAGDRPLGERVAGAWAETRSRFQRWAEREEAAESAARADDLDGELAAAADPATGAERLAALARSDYPRVRALVATHARTPVAVLEALGADRERTVRRAAKDNPALPASLRAAIDAT